MTILRNYQHIARKEHLCHNCGEWILPGQLYSGYVLAIDGKAYDHKEHLDPECPYPDDDFSKWGRADIGEPEKNNLLTLTEQSDSKVA